MIRGEPFVAYKLNASNRVFKDCLIIGTFKADALHRIGSGGIMAHKDFLAITTQADRGSSPFSGRPEFFSKKKVARK